jgi:hypothetical protein
VDAGVEQPYQLRLNKRTDIAEWFYAPLWKQSPAPALRNENPPASRWLVFVDEAGLGSQIVKRLEQANQEVFSARAGEQFKKLTETTFTINPESPEDYKLLLKELAAVHMSPERIVHLWSVTAEEDSRAAFETDERSLKLGFYSLLFLAQALGSQASGAPVHIDVLSSNMQSIAGEQELHPEKATVLGHAK